MKQIIFIKRLNMLAKLQRGYSLMEVLIAVVVLAVGLLGIAGLQVLSIKNTQSAYLRSQATLLAYDIIDSIRVNPAAKASYAIGIGVSPTGTYSSCIGTAANCSTAEVAVYDIYQWKCVLGKWAGAAPCVTGDLASIKGLLPDGDASVVVTGDDVTVTVQWTDKDRREQADTAAKRIVSLDITTRIE